MERWTGNGNGRTGFHVTEESSHERPLGAVVSEFLEQGRRLLRAELKLAGSEVKHEARKAGVGAGLISAGAAVAFIGLMCIAAFLTLALAGAMPAWAAALIVAVLFLAIGAGCAFAGLNRLKRVHGPTQTIETLKEDARWASNTMSAAKSQTHAHA